MAAVEEEHPRNRHAGGEHKRQPGPLRQLERAQNVTPPLPALAHIALITQRSATTAFEGPSHRRRNI